MEAAIITTYRCNVRCQMCDTWRHPTIWHANNPCSVLEAFALGKAGGGAKICGIPELVRDSETGLTFEPGDAADLREKIETLAADEGKIKGMGLRARSYVEREFHPEKHYRRLLEIYEKVIIKKAN